MVKLRTQALRGCAVGLAAALALVGGASCSSSDGEPPTPGGHDDGESVGSVGLELTLGSGAVLDEVSYAISGPGGFSKTGTFDVSKSNKISGIVGGIPAGSGYSIELSATSVDGATSCAGSASFSVKPRVTTNVVVIVRCREAPSTGSVLVNGTLNICPVIDGIAASPAEVYVGEKLALEALAHDSDAGPKPLSYTWKASSGSISDAKAAAPFFLCEEVGPATVKLSVGDGDCGASASVKVQCTAPPLGEKDCSEFDSYMAALGKLTADCRGTVDPRQYTIDAGGALRPAFDSCINQSSMLPILQLLSLQDWAEQVPLAKKCMGGRFEEALKKFKERGVEECPRWSFNHVANPLTDAVLERIIGQLPKPQADGTLVGEVPVGVLAALKQNEVYDVAFEGPAPSQQCKDANDCGQVCAEAFPGFVIGSDPAAGQILIDPTAWLDTTVFASKSSDPYQRPGYYHPMSYYGGAPGVQFGAYNRYWSCNPLDPAGSACIDSCSYYLGAGLHKKTGLQVHCSDPDKAATCVTYCGPPLVPGLATPPLPL